MYVVTRKGAEPAIYANLVEATTAAVEVSDPPCWIWRLEVNRLGALKRIEVPREEIRSINSQGIWCIQNRPEKGDLEPANGQLFFRGNGRQVEILEYRRHRQAAEEDRPPARTDQLGRFVREVTPKVQIKSPEVVGHYLLDKIYTPFADFDQEEMYVLLLDSRLRITHQVMVYRGANTWIRVRPAELLKEAVRFNAPALILAHNHPSGDASPSEDDRLLTVRVIEAARLLDLTLHDHLIVGDKSWVSLRQEGLRFD